MSPLNNSISASSLYHYTKRMSTLQLILKNGIRFSFSLEPLSPKIIANLDVLCDGECDAVYYENTGIAIPMISFCDIPITRAYTHIYRYGRYMIGLDKDVISRECNSIINPVIYVSSQNLENCFIDCGRVFSETCAAEMNKVIEICNSGKKINKHSFKSPEYINFSSRKYNMRFIIGLIKPYEDPQTHYCYYNEREWRAFIPDNMLNDDLKWKYGILKDEYDKNVSDWNNHSHYLTLPEESLKDGITHIVVKKEAEIQEMIETILTTDSIFGNKDVSDETRHVLASRVTSLQRIVSDY